LTKIKNWAKLWVQFIVLTQPFKGFEGVFMLQQLVIKGIFLCLLGFGVAFAQDQNNVQKIEGKELVALKREIASGSKPKITFQAGDYTLTIDGRLKAESYYDDNAYLLNDHIPDETSYFKETLDLNFDFEYGKKKYGYNAMEAYIDMRHKSVWGYALKYADRDAGASTPIFVKMSESTFGQHSHATGRSLLWLREAWMKIGLNALVGNGGDKVQYLTLGWFPFQLGRGIALGDSYGSNQGFLGLYNYPGDDKTAPGILLSGEVVKDTLWYDVYYSRFEERGKSLNEIINPVKAQYIGRKSSPWRGVAKDDDLIAGRLKWKPVDNSKYGKLELEPYAMCDFASDQYIEINPDSKTTLGAAGLGLEHTWKDFEWGGEVAFNFGQEKLVSIDRNTATIKRDPDSANNSSLREVYSNISVINPGTGDVVRANAGLSEVDPSTNISVKNYALKEYDVNTNHNGGMIDTSTIFKNTGNPNQISTKDRFRQGYTNDLRGWMGVIDAAYNWRKYNLKFAAAYNYASGDTDPHREQKSKTYKGFIGLHEFYIGKRVPSLFILDQRLLKCPLALPNPANLPNGEVIDIESDMSFTDIQFVGLGVTWSPMVGKSTVNINPNALVYWNACDSHKIIINADKSVSISPDLASKFFGTEFNLAIRSEIIKDLTAYGVFAMFIPGTYFKDVTGIPLDDDYFSRLAEEVQAGYDPKDFRLGHDLAYHMNIGFEYKF